MIGTIGVHKRHCYQGEHEDCCKYGDKDCPARPEGAQQGVQVVQEQHKSVGDAGVSNLVSAAQAVIDGWHTPLWKDVPSTANYIQALEKALRDMPQPATPTAAPLVQGRGEKPTTADEKRASEIMMKYGGKPYNQNMLNCVAVLLARHRNEALVEASPSAEAARIAELEGALEQVLIGGNHLACVLMQDADFPRANVPEEKVAEYFGAGSTMHEVWICWRAIMHARAALTKPAAQGGK